MSETAERVETREDVLRVLRAHEAELRAMGIERLDLFGSFARNEAGPESDVDLYAVFGREGGPSLFDYVAYQDWLAELTGRTVDLVSGPFDNGFFYGAFARDAIAVL